MQEVGGGGGEFVSDKNMHQEWIASKGKMWMKKAGIGLLIVSGHSVAAILDGLG